MTLANLRQEIWQQLGEDTDLDPSSDTQYTGGNTTAGPLLDFVVNEAQRYIAFWRNPQSGNSFRFKNLFSHLNFHHQIITGTLTDAGTTTTIVLPSGASTTDDFYRDWTIVTGSENKLLVDYVGSTLTGTIPVAFSTAPASSDTFTLSKNFLWLLNSSNSLLSVGGVNYHISLPSETDRYRSDGNMIEVVRILDLEDNREIERSAFNESYITTLTDTGTPTEWQQNGQTIYFNRVPDESIWYRIDYLRAPTILSNTDSTEEPEIPESFQYGIILWARWWGYMRKQASPEAYAAKRDLIDFLMQRTEVDYFQSTYRTPFGALRRS